MMGDGALQLLKGTLDFLVLRSLATNDSLHGFEILDWIQRGTRDELIVEEGALYPALHRMEKRGLLVAEWGISEKGRRAKYYRLTRAGRSALREHEKTWSRYVTAVANLAQHGPTR